MRNPRPLAAGLLVLLLIAGGCDRLGGEEEPPAGDWQAQAAAIDGVTDYRAENPGMLTRTHVDGPVDYQVLPPVGGDHNGVWLNCNGEVFEQPVPNENAVHSLEHGAVWVTYRPDLPADQVSALAERVQGQDKLFMSPYPELDAPISLQAWGYQLKVDDAGDERIDRFIQAVRVNASPEGPTAPCDGGISGS
jgi:hypothetical protein